MNDRRKMPDGQRETSPRSSASNSDALILVLAEIEDSAICRRSRSRRRRAHNDMLGMLSSETIGMPGACKFSSGLPPRAPRSGAHDPATRGRRNCAMSLILFRTAGGFLVLPDRASLLVSRENGGNLVSTRRAPSGSAASCRRPSSRSSRSSSPPPAGR